MSKSKKSRGQRRRLKVPAWYYALLGVIAVAGSLWIITNVETAPPDISAYGLTPADPIRGDLNAPVTIVEWSQFG
ncbi:MAG: hypothetical protein JXA37_07380 [Chloroflexia bacterium]|nr:hypothetical protein [Chloroflexia bacterium]